MNLLVILLVIVLIVGISPNWGYSQGWGYGPSGGLLGIALLVLLILFLTGRL